MAILRGPRTAHGAATRDEYLAKQRKFLRPGRRPFVWTGAAPTAYLSDARWVCDCPNCNNGPSVDVYLALACCFTCGAILENVVVLTSGEVQDLADLLAPRAVENRVWEGEPFTDVEALNVAVGLPDLATCQELGDERRLEGIEEDVA